MNRPSQGKRGETPAQIMSSKYKMAIRKASQDKEYTPIRLEINDTRRREWRTTGPDVFHMHIAITERGDVRSLEIRRTTEERFSEMLEFAFDNEMNVLFAVIPSTNYNYKWLASHLSDRFWTIVDEDIHKKVAEIASTLQPIRDVEKDQAPVSFQQVQSQTEIMNELNRLRDENEKLKKIQQGIGPSLESQKVTLSVSNQNQATPMNVDNEPKAEKKRGPKKSYASDNAVKTQAREELLKDGTIDRLKAEVGDKWFISEEYRSVKRKKIDEILSRKLEPTVA